MTDDIKPLTPMQAVAKTLEGPGMKQALEAAVSGTGRSADRFRRQALIAISNAHDPKRGTNALLDADRGSLFLAVQTAAATGLDLDPSLGHMALVARGGKVTVSIMYRGLIALAMRSPKIAAIDFGKIHQEDKVLVRQGTNPELDITVDPFKPRGPVVGYYCVTTWAGGHRTFTLLSKKDAEEHRAKVKAGPIWSSDFDGMALKTVVRKEAKHWPIEVPGVADTDDDDSDDVIERSPAPMRDVSPATARNMDDLAGEM